MATGGDLAVGIGVLGLVQGTHGLSLRYDASKAHAAAQARRALITGREPKPAKQPAKPIDSWVIVRHRLDFEARAALGRRRDLVRSRYTGEQVQMEAVLLGDADPLNGGALMPFTYDIELLRGDAGIWHTFRATPARWWTRRDRPAGARARNPDHR